MERDETRSLSGVASRQADDFARLLDGDDGARVKAIVAAIDGLRLAVLATITDEETAERDPGAWMRLELFGHNVAFGVGVEVVRYGRRWLELTQPEIEEYIPEPTAAEMVDAPRTPRLFPEASKLYHPNAIYGIQHVTEERAITATFHHYGLRTREEIETGRYLDEF